MNISPDLWGKHLWHSIHYIAINYPDLPTLEDKNNYRTFYENLKYIIPCEACRKHYTDLLNSELKLTSDILSNQTTLFKWTVDIHNNINLRLNKKEMEYAEAINVLSTDASVATYKAGNLYILILLIIIFLIVKQYKRK